MLSQGFKMFRAWLLALAVTVVVAPMAAQAQPTDDKAEKDAENDDGLYTCRKARGRFKVNLKDEVELKDLITWAMSFRCENFVYGSGVGGRSAKVVMVTPKEMSAGQAWRVWQVALQNMNLAWVKKGNVIEIIEAPKAKRQALPVYQGNTPNSDRMVRALIRPAHLPINELAAVLAELKSKDGEVKTLTNAGLLVVTDFGAHIAKMRQVVRAIDQQVSGEQLYMIRVKYADATELATKLTDLLGTKEEPGAAAATPSSSRSARARARARRRRRNRRNRDEPSGPTATEAESANVVPSKIIAEERTNSLIVLSSEAAYRRVRSLVKRLDLPIDVEGGGRIHVYVLQHADAEELSTTLTTLITGVQPQGSNNQQNQRNRRNPRPQTSSATPGADAFEGQVRVTHDAPTNSLVIVASVKDFLALREVVRRLDTPRSQVYIEATIVEVNVDNTRDVGVSYHAGTGVGEGGLGFGGFQTSQLSTIAVGANPASLATISGAFGGVLGPLIDEASELLGLSIPSYGVLFQALATNSNVNVLSTPHIMTTDNQEAEISVGQNVPYQAAQVGAVGGGANFPGIGTQSIQRKDVALTLKITPQINASANIRLDIDLQIEDIASPDFNGFGPSWSTRSIKDTVVVRDQETVIIGGLMQDRTQNTESKIPLLGDIPVLGYLFKYQTKSKVKTNLLVMLTPYVIREQADLARIKEQRVREQREFVRSFTAFDEFEDKQDIDYRRKRGLLDEINQTIKKVDREIEIRRELENRQVNMPDGLIELDMDDEDEGEDDEDGEDDGGEAGEEGAGN